ncbi:MAG: PIN domain-containing protein [Caldilineaceae bacterium]|nr:PIN domain-containing protein [Caldilineaceae bacterium]HRJ44677.1 PIN domain-containing protein [Caldilineaceae bacterium]
MTRYVIDTHALFWYLTRSPRLSVAAKAVFDEGIAQTAILVIPVIVLAELYYLNEKAGRPLDFVSEYRRIENSSQFEILSLHAQDVVDFTKDSAIVEMHDRMITGVARRLNAACVSRDRNIAASTQIKVIW